MSLHDAAMRSVSSAALAHSPLLPAPQPMQGDDYDDAMDDDGPPAPRLMHPPGLPHMQQQQQALQQRRGSNIGMPGAGGAAAGSGSVAMDAQKLSELAAAAGMSGGCGHVHAGDCCRLERMRDAVLPCPCPHVPLHTFRLHWCNTQMFAFHFQALCLHYERCCLATLLMMPV